MTPTVLTATHKAIAEARAKEQSMLQQLNVQHRATEMRMTEELRFLTVRDQQQNEQRQLLNNYYPEYGKTFGFAEGAASGASALAGGYAGLRVGGSSKMRFLTAGMGLVGGYIGGRSVAEAYSGTETSVQGRVHAQELARYGPGAAYAARSDWQGSQGQILGPESFRNEIAIPGELIANSWGLDSKTFVPGAMDLIESGLVSSPSKTKGREFRDALKDAAGIFKSMQSFFGSVDIAGLTSKIKQLQSAGFTTDDLSSLGRTMQGSSLAFAPERIRNEVYRAMEQAGSRASQMGIASSVAGQSVIAGYSSAYSEYGGLSAFDKSTFRTQQGLGSTISEVLNSTMSNPLLLAGGGDVATGLRNVTGNIDLTSPSGMREFKKTMYDVSSQMTTADQIRSLDTSVEGFMQMSPGLDRESAATALLGDPKKARAYMIHREGLQSTFETNMNYMSELDFSKSRYVGENELSKIMNNATSLRSDFRKKGMLDINTLGVQGTMLRHMANVSAYSSERVGADALMEADSLAGLWSGRALNRMGSTLFDESKDSIQSGIGTAYFGDNAFHKIGLKDPAGARRMAGEVSRVLEGYHSASVDPEGMDPGVLEALDEMESSGGSEVLLTRLKAEATTNNRGTSAKEMSNMAIQAGLPKVAAALANDELRGQFLRGAESRSKGFSTGLTRAMYNATSLNSSKDRISKLTNDLVSPHKSSSWVGGLGETLSNPVVSTGIGVVAGVATALVGTLGSGGLGVGAAAWGGLQVASAVAAGVGALGMGISALAGLSDDNISRAEATKMNASMYGTTLIVDLILGSFPDNLTGVWSRLTEMNKGDKLEAARAIPRTVYGSAYMIYKGNKDISEGEFVDAVVSRVTTQLRSLAKTNVYVNTVLTHYTENRGVLVNLASVMYSYLQGTESPASITEVVTSVGTKVVSLTSNVSESALGGADKRVAVARGLLAGGKGLDTLKTRSQYSATDVAKATAFSKEFGKVIDESIVRNDGDSMSIADTTDVQTIVSDTMKQLQDEGVKDKKTVQARVNEALVAKGFLQVDGGEGLLDQMQGVGATLKDRGELTDAAKNIVKAVLDDEGIKSEIRSLRSTNTI